MMRNILMNDVTFAPEAFETFRRARKNPLDVLRRWFGTTERAKRPAAKPALGL